MSAILFKPKVDYAQSHQEETRAEPQKRSTVTGVHDRSEVESMIQRYLELANSALKSDEQSSDDTPTKRSA